MFCKKEHVCYLIQGAWCVGYVGRFFSWLSWGKIQMFVMLPLKMG